MRHSYSPPPPPDHFVSVSPVHTENQAFSKACSFQTVFESFRFLSAFFIILAVRTVGENAWKSVRFQMKRKLVGVDGACKNAASQFPSRWDAESIKLLSRHSVCSTLSIPFTLNLRWFISFCNTFSCRAIIELTSVTRRLSMEVCVCLWDVPIRSYQSHLNHGMWLEHESTHACVLFVSFFRNEIWLSLSLLFYLSVCFSSWNLAALFICHVRVVC